MHCGNAFVHVCVFVCPVWHSVSPQIFAAANDSSSRAMTATWC